MRGLAALGLVIESEKDGSFAVPRALRGVVARGLLTEMAVIGSFGGSGGVEGSADRVTGALLFVQNRWCCLRVPHFRVAVRNERPDPSDAVAERVELLRHFSGDDEIMRDAPS